MKPGDMVYSVGAFHAVKYGTTDDWRWIKHPCVGIVISTNEGIMLDPDTGEQYAKVLLCDHEMSGLFMVTLSHKLRSVSVDEP